MNLTNFWIKISRNFRELVELCVMGMLLSQTLMLYKAFLIAWNTEDKAVTLYIDKFGEGLFEVTALTVIVVFCSIIISWKVINFYKKMRK